MTRKRTGYDAACYYDGKLLGLCTKADSDAYTLLMNACLSRGLGDVYKRQKQKGGGNHATQTDGL